MRDDVNVIKQGHRIASVCLMKLCRLFLFSVVVSSVRAVHCDSLPLVFNSAHYSLGLYRIADFTIRPNKNNSFYYLAEYE